jgi:hypothetical protein
MSLLSKIFGKSKNSDFYNSLSPEEIPFKGFENLSEDMQQIVMETHNEDWSSEEICENCGRWFWLRDSERKYNKKNRLFNICERCKHIGINNKMRDM